MMSLGLYSNVWLGLIIIGTQVVEGLTKTFWVESLALTLYTLVHFIAQYVHYVNAHAFAYMACNVATAR